MNEEILLRIQAWCARAEHSSAEVADRLTRWGVDEGEILPYLDALAADNYINDARFLSSFVQDKWRIQGWGKVKIAHALVGKGFGEADVTKALQAISDEEYSSFREDLMREKSISLPFAPPDVQAGKLYSFAVSRGLEEDWVREWLDRKGYLDEI